MATKFTEKHEIQFYECDVTGKLTLPMLLNIVIKTSESQSEALGRGSDFVNSLGLGWVITQHEMTITRLPKTEELVSVTTEATSYNKYFCYRNFWIHDESGQECVAISSTFVLMDLTTRKMISVPLDIIEAYDCEKITKILRGTKISSLEEDSDAREYRVRFSDIDGNKHVNNSRYLDWMVDSLAYKFLTSHEPTFVNIRFDKELAYGNSVTSHWQEASGEQLISKHRIKLDGTLCAEANISWRSM